MHELGYEGDSCRLPKYNHQSSRGDKKSTEHETVWAGSCYILVTSSKRRSSR